MEKMAKSFILIIPLLSIAAGVIVYNETAITDLGTTTVTNTTKVVSAANYTTDEMVETSCHIISEQLVATATATVSSAFSDLCRSDELETQLSKIQDTLVKQMKSLESKVEKIMDRFFITYNNTV